MEASKPKNVIPGTPASKSKFLATSIHESAFRGVCSGVAVDVSDCSPSNNRSVASIVTNAEIASIFDHVADSWSIREVMSSASGPIEMLPD